MTPTSLDLATAEQFARDWEAVFDRGDSQSMAEAYTEDATLIASQTETVVGRPAIERFWRATTERARASGMTRKVHVEHVETTGDLGYMRGTVVIQAGEQQAIVVRYVTVWKRQADGVWRLAVDISSPAPPAVLPQAR
jgi:uncharacterized protein (TIGR02246 family)